MMRSVFVLLVAVALALPAFGGQGPSLVVAVDSSRSLKAADIAAVHDALSRGLEGLSPKLPVGLVTFDDNARWVVNPGSDRTLLLEALRSVEPSGTTTVLYDGIFLAAQGMEGGGALVVISDGRDENSAVTVSDIEALCARQSVRLLTVGVGRTVDDKALRRLAMLTRGEYLGGSIDSLPEGLPGVLDSIEIPPETDQQRPDTDERKAEDPLPMRVADQPHENEEVAGSSGSRSWPGLIGWGLAFLLAVGGGCTLWSVLNRRRSDRCAVCGAAVDEDGDECTACQIEAIRTSAETREVADEEATRVPDLGVGAMAFETRPDDVDHTVALGEVAVLTVHEEGREAREYTLPRDRIFAVGRAPKVNTLQVRDQTVSAQHFKVVFKDSRFYVVDLWTTNGTSVNHECVRVHPLSSGDVIRAGMSEFVFSSKSEMAPKEGPKTPSPSGKAPSR